MKRPHFNKRQTAAWRLIRNDLRFIYTILMNSNSIASNYMVFMMPYIGLTIDGAEDWIKAYNHSNKTKIDAPLFSNEEQSFYEIMRSSIKLLDRPYSMVYSLLKETYSESDKYFAKCCKPIAKVLKLYDIFGADIVDGHYCGNTILGGCYVPNYHYGKNNGETIKRLSEICGRYIKCFDALEPYNVTRHMKFESKDFGGFIPSPVGNKFSHKFILFSLLCQINFIIKCICDYIIGAETTKLRFSYLQYYYLASIISDVNKNIHSNFTINIDKISNEFRNAMAHYKIGVALKESEVRFDDPFYGVVQKYFNCDTIDLKDWVVTELQSVSNQIETYLEL